MTERKDAPVPLLYSGKVRELYELADDLILLVASDRISAFDFILPTTVPDKGRVLTRLSAFWFRELAGIMPNHVVEEDFRKFPEAARNRPEMFEGRSLVVRKVKKYPVEAVVRGYLAGSGWAEYRESRSVCGVKLPPGLKLSDRLPEPIFTPATKAETGEHDENIDFARCAGIIGEEAAGEIRSRSLELYREASSRAREKGIIIADTKFEFGVDPDGRLILIDEIFTPDSSRFWEAETYRPGQEQDSLDKQFVRNYLIGIAWNRQPPAPALPGEVVEKTRRKYHQVYEMLTGQALDR